jgi:hypothetical protein
MFLHNSILNQTDIEYIFSLDEVQNAKKQLDKHENGKIYFTIVITHSIRNALQTRFGLDLSGISNIPMRWIKGDTSPHIDNSPSAFDKTYLVYLNDSLGEFLIGDTSFAIHQNTGFVFNEGISHSVINTGAEPRLLLGPMNEFAEPVGISVTYYYPSESDALANTNLLVAYGSYTIILTGGFTKWRIASNSTGSSPQNIIYNVDDVLAGTGSEIYYLYPSIPCFLEGTTILCSVNGAEEYVPVEKLNNGTLVKTSLNGFKQVVALGKCEIINPGNDDRIENRLYKCSTTKYPTLTNDLYITGCHSILEFPISEIQKQKIINHIGKLYVTDNKYRLMACVDDRAEPWNSKGTYTIYHFALDHENDSMNYGVYANGGLLLETCSIRTMQKQTNMTLI